jgi:hypothetical protein
MSDFDEIIKGLPEGPGDDGPLENIWQALEALWPEFYEGVLVKGILIAEYVDKDGERVLRFITAPNTAPWDSLGMLESARGDARDLSQCASFRDDDEDPEED